MGKFAHIEGRYIALLLLPYVSVCAADCSSDPPYRPEIPLFSERDWGRTLSEGTVAKYYCPAKYRSVSGKNTSSTCTNRAWTPLETHFKCERVQCPENIPQVPMYGDTDWNKVDRYAGQKIRYFCLKYYYSRLPGIQIEVTCGNDGKWTNLPSGFDCVTFSYAQELGLDPQIKDVYDYYSNGPRKDEKYVNTYNWLLYITVPCFIGIGIALFCCLCCTRTDSPIFWLCRGNTKNDKYLWG